MRIKLGNCFFPGCNHEPYRKRENLRQAEGHYLKALEYIRRLPPGSPGASSYLAKFSYGHVLSLKASRDIADVQRREALELSHKLLREVVDTVKTKVGEVTEPKIQMTLYYMLAICSKEVGNPTEANRYVTEIYERGGKLPPIDGFRIFSPLSKNDLTYLDFKRELRQFESRLSNGSQATAGAAA